MNLCGFGEILYHILFFTFMFLAIFIFKIVDLSFIVYRLSEQIDEFQSLSFESNKFLRD